MFDYPGISQGLSGNATLSVNALAGYVMDLIKRMNFTQPPDVAG
jgi:hypothetical protein